jgi:hypothetical protein
VTDPRALVGALLDAVTVELPASHSWFGVRARALPADMQDAMTPATARAYLVYSLQSRVYADFYCPGGARPAFDEVPGVAPGPSLTPFVQQLSAANTGTGALETGWRLVESADDALIVARGDGLRFRAQPGEVVVRDAGPPVAGASIAVLMPKELMRLSPGFYMALGDAAFAGDGSVALVRLYWNVRADAAARLMEALTRPLNEARVPFRLKVAGAAQLYRRCDAGVLYLPREAFPEGRTIVREAHAALADGLGAETPALTKRLARGLGLAEDPAGGTSSFGLSRSHLLAESMVRAAERGATSTDERLAVVAECFSEEGIELDLPFIEAGSADHYSLDDA